MKNSKEQNKSTQSNNKAMQNKTSESGNSKATKGSKACK